MKERFSVNFHLCQLACSNLQKTIIELRGLVKFYVYQISIQSLSIILVEYCILSYIQFMGDPPLLNIFLLFLSFSAKYSTVTWFSCQFSASKMTSP